MKKLISITAMVLACATVNAQMGKEVKKDAKEGAQDVKEGAKAVGHKTAKVASKTTSRVIDQRYKGKGGPHGETVFIDNQSKYYYVGKKGEHIYITEAEMTNKK